MNDKFNVNDKLSKEDSFNFSCKKELSCFNKCCQDVNIFLTPYDVIRIKARLNISSSEFLERFTICPFTEDQKLPVLLLKLNDNQEKTCPFVSKDGCTIYEDRPWSCRMYPIGLASQKIRTEDEGEEYYFKQEDVFCQGMKQSTNWTVEKWIQDQEIDPYDKFSSMYKEIILHPYFKKGQDLTPQKMDMFHTVFYDLDKFRNFVFKSTFLKRFDISDRTLEKIKDSDTRLLSFGVDWLKLCLFGEPTIKLKGEIRDKEEEVTAHC